MFGRSGINAVFDAHRRLISIASNTALLAHKSALDARARVRQCEAVLVNHLKALNDHRAAIADHRECILDLREQVAVLRQRVSILETNDRG